MLTSLLAMSLAAALQNSTDKEAKPAEEKKICTVEQVSSSSRLGRKRVCRTEREMKERQEQIERDSRL